MTSEGEAWAQTLITVTPEEDATLREILDTVTLSSSSDTPLVLDPHQIGHRQSLTYRQFIDTEELEQEKEEEQEEEQAKEPEQKEFQDAENQTYLQGIPEVQVPVEYTEKSSQTVYMAAPCPPLKYFRDIMTSMNDGPLPEMKQTDAAATIISFDPETSLIIVSERLSTNIPEEEIEEFETELDPDDKVETEITDILNFALLRAYWIIDPSQANVESIDNETQTLIRFNHHTQTLFIDNEAQTDLTCEPKQSNSMLLADHLEAKSMISDYLEDYFSKGLEAVMMAEDIIDEVIDKCAERIKYPMKEQVVQTIASYKLDEKKEDVIKKLGYDIIVDPLESSVIVVPLFTDLLETVCETVCRNAIPAAENAVKHVLLRTDTIITKLIKIQIESQPRRIDEILEKRKKKIIESLSKKKDTETISTQTSVTGVWEVKRLEKPKEILCSVCRRQSMCQWCLGDQEAEDVPQEDVKILRTQDILLAYKPCYIVTTASQKKQNLKLVCPPVIEVQKPPPKPPKPPKPSKSTDESEDTINICLRTKKTIKPQESFNEWSYVADATLMKPFSIEESTSETTLTSFTKSYQSSCCNRSLTPQAYNALQILKDIFCNQESCVKGDEQVNDSMCSICSGENNSKGKMSNRGSSCTQQTCKALTKLQSRKTSCCNESITSNNPEKSQCDAFKIIPICICQDSKT